MVIFESRAHTTTAMPFREFFWYKLPKEIRDTVRRIRLPNRSDLNVIYDLLLYHPQKLIEANLEEISARRLPVTLFSIINGDRFEICKDWLSELAKKNPG
jgi:hypothetical protein